MRQLIFSSSLFLLVLIPSKVLAQAIPVSLAPDRWVIDDKILKVDRSKSLENNGKLVNFRGRESLRLAKGIAYARDVVFQNGTIDVDMAPDPAGQFLGILFRVQAEDSYELIFFRPGDAGTTQAIQYTPGLLGANAWQIYTGPGYTAPTEFPDGKWIHVRIVVAGTAAKLFLNDATAPSLVIPELRSASPKGSIGFWAHTDGGYFSNLTYTPDNTAYPLEAKKDFLPGTLTDWQLSEMFDAGDKNPAVYPDARSLKWEKVEAENPGMVVINRYRRSPNIPVRIAPEERWKPVPGSKVVFARTAIHSERDEVRKMHLGYSDEIVIYVNSKPIFAGNNTIGFREPNFLGLMNVNNDEVFLPLKKGDNEIVLAVTEFFGGWGFICQLDDAR